MHIWSVLALLRQSRVPFDEALIEMMSYSVCFLIPDRYVSQTLWNTLQQLRNINVDVEKYSIQSHINSINTHIRGLEAKRKKPRGVWCVTASNTAHVRRECLPRDLILQKKCITKICFGCMHTSVWNNFVIVLYHWRLYIYANSLNQVGNYFHIYTCLFLLLCIH